MDGVSLERGKFVCPEFFFFTVTQVESVDCSVYKNHLVIQVPISSITTQSCSATPGEGVTFEC